MMNQLNYDALTAPLTKQDLRNYTASRGAAGVVGRFFAGFVVIVGVVVLISMAVVTMNAIRLGDAPGRVGSFVGISIPIVIALVIAFSVRAETRRLARLYKFSQMNGITMAVNTPGAPYDGLIFNQGHSKRVRLALSFPGDIEVGNYEYVTGSGKSRTTHTWGYVAAKLPRRLPHMVLDAKKNNFFGTFSNLPAGFGKDQVLHLQGTFSDHFTLYAPKEYERDAFYVFTPDVMAALVDAGGRYDIEVIDDMIFLYAHLGMKMDTEQHLRDLLAITQRIKGELHDQTDYYTDERVGDRALNSIATPGRRLKSRLAWSTVVMLILFMLYAAWMIISNILSL